MRTLFDISKSARSTSATNIAEDDSSITAIKFYSTSNEGEYASDDNVEGNVFNGQAVEYAECWTDGPTLHVTIVLADDDNDVALTLNAPEGTASRVSSLAYVKDSYYVFDNEDNKKNPHVFLTSKTPRSLARTSRSLRFKK